MRQDVLTSALYVFCNWAAQPYPLLAVGRQRVLAGDEKRVERATFAWPRDEAQVRQMSLAQLACKMPHQYLVAFRRDGNPCGRRLRVEQDGGAHTRSVALYCAEQGLAIRCNSIHPAAILTPMWEPMLDCGTERKRTMKKFVRDTPLRCSCLPEEVAALAVLLASDEATCISAAELNIDGDS